MSAKNHNKKSELEEWIDLINSDNEDEMSNKITEPRITIQAKDIDGSVKNLTCASWSKITGSPASTIRYLYRRNKSGVIDLTNRQVVGLDEIRYHERCKQAVKPKTQTRHDLTKAFLNRRLGGPIVEN